MNKKVFLGLFFIIIVIVISFISYSNRFIDENEALKISTEKLAQPYDKYQVFLIKDTKRLSYLDSKYYEIQNPEQYKAIWFVTYEIDGGKKISSIYINAKNGEILSSWLINNENGEIIDKNFLHQ